MPRAGVIGIVAALLIAPGLAACGGSSDEGSAEAWANDVCGSLNTWFAEVDSALEGLTDEGLQLDRADIDDTIGAVQDAPVELGNDLDELPPLETEAGSSAEDSVGDLRETLRDDVETIEDALDGSAPPLDAVSKVAGALASAADALQESYETLVELDPGGELEAALEDAAECDALRDQLASIGG